MRARLLTPELVSIQPINHADTRSDDLAGEPYANLARSSTIVIRGQVDELDRNRRQPGWGGATVSQRSSITFLAVDVRAKSWSPAAGDWISALSDLDGGSARSVSWYVSEVHYSGKDGRRAKLVVVDVAPRPPSRAAVEGL